MVPSTKSLELVKPFPSFVRPNIKPQSDILKEQPLCSLVIALRVYPSAVVSSVDPHKTLENFPLHGLAIALEAGILSLFSTANWKIL